jgi:Protein of unknown function (DUF998)
MTVSTTALLAVAAAVAVVLGLAFLARLHLAPTGVDPARDAVSAYGIGPYRAWYRAMALAFGVGALLLAAALDRGGGVAAAGLALLVVYGVARIAIVPFPTDQDGARPTTSGRIHALLAVVAFVAIAVAAPIISASLRAPSDWPEGAEIARSMAVMVIAACALLLAAGLIPRMRLLFGGFQRLFYGASQVWLLVVAVIIVWRGGGSGP